MFTLTVILLVIGYVYVLKFIETPELIDTQKVKVNEDYCFLIYKDELLYKSRHVTIIIPEKVKELINEVGG